MKYKSIYSDCDAIRYKPGKNRRKSAARRAYAMYRRMNDRPGGGKGWRKYDNPTPSGFKPMTREQFLGQAG